MTKTIAHTDETTAVPKPAHGTAEWAVHNINIDSGCPNRCRYCYAESMAIRFGRKTPDTWGSPTTDLTRVNGKYGKKSGRIMFPTSHDIHPANIDACLTVLLKMLASGNDVLVVSKPRLGCIQRLCEQLTPYRHQVTFRFTMGSADNGVLSAWEPDAPTFEERLASLAHAFTSGYQTSVSCEPMLDTNIDDVIRQVRPFISDSIWLGKASNLLAVTANNCPGDSRVRLMALNLIAMMTDSHIHDLYRRYQNDPIIKWKDSLKNVLGLERPTAKGLDV